MTGSQRNCVLSALLADRGAAAIAQVYPELTLTYSEYARGYSNVRNYEYVQLQLWCGGIDDGPSDYATVEIEICLLRAFAAALAAASTQPALSAAPLEGAAVLFFARLVKHFDSCVRIEHVQTLKADHRIAYDQIDAPFAIGGSTQRVSVVLRAVSGSGRGVVGEVSYRGSDRLLNAWFSQLSREHLLKRETAPFAVTCSLSVAPATGMLVLRCEQLLVAGEGDLMELAELQLEVEPETPLDDVAKGSAPIACRVNAIGPATARAQLDVYLGSVQLSLNELLELKPGAAIALQGLDGAEVSLQFGGYRVAAGKIVEAGGQHQLTIDNVCWNFGSGFESCRCERNSAVDTEKVGPDCGELLEEIPRACQPLSG